AAGLKNRPVSKNNAYSWGDVFVNLADLSALTMALFEVLDSHFETAGRWLDTLGSFSWAGYFHLWRKEEGELIRVIREQVQGQADKKPAWPRALIEKWVRPAEGWIRWTRFKRISFVLLAAIYFSAVSLLAFFKERLPKPAADFLKGLFGLIGLIIDLSVCLLSIAHNVLQVYQTHRFWQKYRMFLQMAALEADLSPRQKQRLVTNYLKRKIYGVEDREIEAKLKRKNPQAPEAGIKAKVAAKRKKKLVCKLDRFAFCSSLPVALEMIEEIEKGQGELGEAKLLELFQKMDRANYASKIGAALYIQVFLVKLLTDILQMLSPFFYLGKEALTLLKSLFGWTKVALNLEFLLFDGQAVSEKLLGGLYNLGRKKETLAFLEQIKDFKTASETELGQSAFLEAETAGALLLDGT
ncbi:MAG: hypothetical protein WC371_05850, partial [Parachlamydiales bacterium]